MASLSSLQAGASAGTLTGKVANEAARGTTAKIEVRLNRYGAKKAIVGHATVKVPAKTTIDYRVKVKLPADASKGNYYLSACAPSAAGGGLLSCATSADDVLVKGGLPIRGVGATASAAKAKSAAAEDCTAGGRTLSKPGTRVYPETGNTGYTSVHTDVFVNYDAVANNFLDGTHVDLLQHSTQCLSEFSLDFERTNSNSGGPNMTVGSVTINGQPATFTFKQPTYPGDPNGQDDPDPAAHAASLTNPVSATNANPPACSSTGTAGNGTQCPANKLVITPATPIPSGTDFTVTVNYTGRPGVHVDGDGSTEGFFRSTSPANDGGFVTTEPLGTMAWMPLNNHPSVKPTYDFYDTVAWDPAKVDAAGVDSNRVAIGNGRLISTTINNADTRFGTSGSRSYHWKSSEPVASYLVENSLGFYSLDERQGANNVLYYQAQTAAVSPSQSVINKALMDQQEGITHFQERFNGLFPFNADGVVVGTPGASFEEEMQTKITFAGSSVGRTATSTGTLSHENMHQWWGDNVSEGAYNLTFFKEGFANMSESLDAAWTAAKNNGGLDTPTGDAAFEASLVSTFNGTYNSTSGSFWNVAPSNPQSSNLFGQNNTYTRPGRTYIALRAILGKANFASALQDIQKTYGGGSITEAQEIAKFHKWMPNQSIGCANKLDAFFKQWFDTPYTGSPAAGNKPQITGPGLAGPGFYDANGGCSDYGNDQGGAVNGTVPATLSLTLGTPASFSTFTPGVAKDYTASTTATVISSAGDATLAVADPSSTATGHLVNGTFSLPQALQVSGNGTAFSPVSGSAAPTAVKTYAAPVSNDVAAITFKQPIASTDALRTGTYAKSLTFTLSTTTP